MSFFAQSLKFLGSLPFASPFSVINTLENARRDRSLAESKARRALEESRVKADTLRRERQKARALDTARLHARGITAIGSPSLALLEQEEQDRADINDILRFGIQDARNFRREARRHQSNAYFNSADQIFKILAGLYDAGK